MFILNLPIINNYIIYNQEIKDMVTYTDDDHDEEDIDFLIIGRARAAVLRLVTFTSISDHKTVALEVLTTATQYSLCLCLS